MPKTSNPLNQKGMVTILELTVAVAILLVMTSIIAFYLKPVKNQQRGKDAARITDIFTISRAIEEYRLDKNVLPDVINTTRTSNILPVGNTSLSSANSGWIDADFLGYLTRLPVDPVNTGANVYKYRTNGTTYELNAVLEIDNEKLMQNDGGNNTAVYEKGTNLTLIN